MDGFTPGGIPWGLSEASVPQGIQTRMYADPAVRQALMPSPGGVPWMGPQHFGRFPGAGGPPPSPGALRAFVDWLGAQGSRGVAGLQGLGNNVAAGLGSYGQRVAPYIAPAVAAGRYALPFARAATPPGLIWTAGALTGAGAGLAYNAANENLPPTGAERLGGLGYDQYQPQNAPDLPTVHPALYKEVAETLPRAHLLEYAANPTYELSDTLTPQERVQVMQMRQDMDPYTARQEYRKTMSKLTDKLRERGLDYATIVDLYRNASRGGVRLGTDSSIPGAIRNVPREFRGPKMGGDDAPPPPPGYAPQPIEYGPKY